MSLRRWLLVVLCVGCVWGSWELPYSWGQETEAIGAREGLAVTPWEQARDFLGQKVVVTGEVVRVGHRPTIHFINFTEERDQFTAVVFRGQPLGSLNRLWMTST